MPNFADDILLLAEDASMPQQMTTSLGTKGSNIRLRISGEKSKIMHIGLSQPTKPIIVGQSQLAEVDVFQYLESNIANDGEVDTYQFQTLPRLSQFTKGSTMYGFH